MSLHFNPISAVNAAGHPTLAWTARLVQRLLSILKIRITQSTKMTQVAAGRQRRRRSAPGPIGDGQAGPGGTPDFRRLRAPLHHSPMDVSFPWQGDTNDDRLSPDLQWRWRAMRKSAILQRHFPCVATRFGGMFAEFANFAFVGQMIDGSGSFSRFHFSAPWPTVASGANRADEGSFR